MHFGGFWPPLYFFPEGSCIPDYHPNFLLWVGRGGGTCEQVKGEGGGFSGSPCPYISLRTSGMGPDPESQLNPGWDTQATFRAAEGALGLLQTLALNPPTGIYCRG